MPFKDHFKYFKNFKFSFEILGNSIFSDSLNVYVCMCVTVMHRLKRLHLEAACFFFRSDIGIDSIILFDLRFIVNSPMDIFC